MDYIEINKDLDKEFKLSIVNEDDRLIAGWASVEVVDKQGQYIDVQTLAKAMLKFMDRGGFINYGHENKPVGKVLQWEIRKHPDTGKPGVWIIAKINKGYKLDDIVWNLVKSGKLKGFSIAGLGGVEKKIMKADDGTEHEVEVLKDVELTEISIVEEPANPFATIEEVSVFAKGSVKEIMKSDFVQGIMDEIWERVDEILQKYGVQKSVVIADEIVDDIEKSFEKYIEYIQKFVMKAEGTISSDTEGIHNVVYGDVEQKPEDKKKKKEEKQDEDMLNEETANEEAKKDGRIILKDIESLEGLEIIKSDDKYIVKRLSDGSETVVFEKDIIEFKKPEDLRPPKEWWERCVDETGNEQLCGWVYYHHLKPEKPPGQKDKSHTRKARQRKKKWLKEKKSGVSTVKINDIKKKLSELKKIVPVQEDAVEIRKPFAGFKNWNDCMKKMKKQGYDKESATKICGKLKAKYEKALIKKKVRKVKV